MFYKNKSRANLDGEEWVTVLGFNGYEVSNLGRVRNKSGLVLSQGINREYLILGLTKYSEFEKKRFSVRVHRILYESFTGKELGDLTVHHINGVKTDNRLENLEALTLSDNKRKDFASGNNVYKLSPNDIIKIRGLSKDGVMGKDIAKTFNVSESTISDILTGKKWGYLK